MTYMLPEFVIATDVTFEAYLEQYMGEYAEWVNGKVIKMSPVKLRHDQLVRYLTRLLEIYFELRPIGSVHNAPFVMRISKVQSAREPDIQIILHSNPGAVTDSFMDGAADLCIEVVSEESIHRDYEIKRQEYARGGVGEYWIIDPLKEEAHFYRLSDETYSKHEPDEQGNYQTPALPGLKLNVPTLWQENLPKPIAVMKILQAMLGDETQ